MQAGLARAENYSFSTLAQFCGRVIGVSDWISVGQDRIDQFAECTDDHQWVHTDVDRAARESPFGGTVAHGFLTLALLVPMQWDSGLIPHDVRHVVSCGVDHLRFISPVKAGMRLRARVELLAVHPLSQDRLIIETRNTVESDSGNSPVMIGDIALQLTR